MPYPNDPPINVPNDPVKTLSLEQLQELMTKLRELGGPGSQPEGDLAASCSVKVR